MSNFWDSIDSLINRTVNSYVGRILQARNSQLQAAETDNNVYQVQSVNDDGSAAIGLPNSNQTITGYPGFKPVRKGDVVTKVGVRIF